LYCAGAAFKPGTNSIEAALFSYIKGHAGSTYVLQDQQGLIDLAGIQPVRAENGGLAQKIAEILAPLETTDNFLEAFRRVTRTFASVQSWLEAAALHDHSISTRIHGAIMSLMAGVPTVVIAHDVRMRELCASMAIPFLRQADALQYLDCMDRFFGQVSFDGTAFDLRRLEIAKRYCQYFIESQLAPTYTLRRIAGLHGAIGEAPAENTREVGMQSEVRSIGASQ